MPAEGAWTKAFFDADHFAAIETVGRSSEESVPRCKTVAGAAGGVLLAGVGG